MPKEVSIVTFSSEVGKFYAQQLKDLFGSAINIKNYSFEENSLDHLIYSDVAIISNYTIYETVKNYISQESEVVITNITISKEGLTQIMNIPSGTKAMLVNLSAEMSLETISLLYHLGANHVEFIPVYPGMKEIPNLDVAVTPGETRFIPSSVNKIIDIGHRLLDTNTIVEIALKLKLENLLQGEAFKKYFSNIVSNSYSIEELTGKTTRLQSQFDILLNILDEGIVGVNAQGIVFAYSKSAEKIIGIRKEYALGKNSIEILPELPFKYVFETLKPIKSRLIKIRDVYINLNIAPVISMGKLIGAFAIVQKFTESERQQHKLRSQLLNKGYRAKYTFDDIIGESHSIVKTKEIAIRMSKTDAPILITGESGTGKELFAQSIHNSSNRNNFPFVAVNCAALPESLLESELFGYEDGAFTGAKKGGKLGLFEFAHGGTLFLDEIEEMSLNLQAKLLRVLQEKEVMRIGGDSLINVDVRIIAATNEDLKELVKKGAFRKDLYYRLNVLPLSIPPLRERGKDILLLIEKIKQDLNSNFEMSLELKELFLRHTWEGNVRELRNYIEYLTCIGSETVTAKDIPFNFTVKDDAIHKININESDEFKGFKEFVGNKINAYSFVIEQMASSYKNKRPIGRRTLARAAEKMNIFITEPEIRNILLNLEKYNLVTISRGRGGSKLTELGLKFFKEMQKG